LLGKALEVNLATALEFERTVIATMGTPEERAEAREEAARTSATYAAIFGKGEKA
jgi:hypothetical protein